MLNGPGSVCFYNLKRVKKKIERSSLLRILVNKTDQNYKKHLECKNKNIKIANTWCLLRITTLSTFYTHFNSVR